MRKTASTLRTVYNPDGNCALALPQADGMGGAHRHITIWTAFWVLSAIYKDCVPFELLDSAARL
jgi:hypothetical protein